MKNYEDILGYSTLTKEQQKLLERMQQRHQNAWESEKRRLEHSIEQMKRVEWDEQEKCLKVYYQADWYHYGLDGSWY